jgi:Ca-activated chloride channel family protein
VGDAAKIAGTYTTDALPVRVALALNIRDRNMLGNPDSPSHALKVERKTVSFAAEDAALDRDVVVRWSTAATAAGVGIDVARPAVGHARAHEAFALLTVTPPKGSVSSLPRDLIVLLDTSGSMGGQPLDQAKRVIAALIDGLTDRDRIELIEFSMRPRRWQNDPVFATAANKTQAQRWLTSLQARGGTEMKEGLLAAMSGLRAEAQRQVVLVSDGYIGFEAEIVGAIMHGLPAGSRLHTVGVGSAVNRSLTQPSARAGRGVEIVIGVDEDPERATQRLLAATEDPLLVDLVVEGDALLELAPARPHDLFAASPALLSARIKPEGGALIVHARTPSGSWEQRLSVPAIEPGEGAMAVAALYGREAVEDLETRRAAGETDLDALVERHGIEFQISTRLTSWIAVSHAPTVDPTAPTRSTTMPHALPHGTSVAGFGLRQAAVTRGAFVGQGFAVAAAHAVPAAGPAGSRPPAPKGRAGIVARSPRLRRQAQEEMRTAPPQPGRSSPPSPKKDESPSERKTMIADADTFDRMADDLAAPEPLPRAVQRVQGTWMRVGDRWVFEFTAPAGGLAWAPPSAIDVTLDDGTTHVLTVEPGSTAPGSIAAGVTVRIVVPVPAALPSQTPTEVAIGDDLRVEL